LNGAPIILRNEGTRNHWIGIKLAGSNAGRQGIGARVTIIDSNERRQIFDVSTAGSYLSANDPRVVAGVGNASAIKTVEVRWPSGGKQTILNPTFDRYITITEPDVKQK